MNISISEQKENTILGRKEITATVLFEGNSTPNRKDIQKEIAKQIKSKEELTIINTIKTNFGEAKATISARAYNDEESMKAIERKNLVEKHAGHEAKEEKAE